MQLWRIPSQGGAPTQVTSRGGLRPAVSQDGKAIYYARGDEIWCVPADGGEEMLVLTGVAGAEFAHWAPANGGLYFRAREDTPATLNFMNFKDGRITPIMRIEKAWDVGAIAVSPDGRYLLFNQIDQSGGDLMGVENFR